MASINMSIRTDSELKAQAEKVLSQLGMKGSGCALVAFAQFRAVPVCGSAAGKNRP